MVKIKIDFTENETYATTYANFFHRVVTCIFSYSKCASTWWKLWCLFSRISSATLILSNISYFIIESYSLRDFAFLSITGIVPSLLIIVRQVYCYKCTEEWVILKKILEEDFAVTLNLEACDRVENLKPLLKRIFSQFIPLYVIINEIVVLSCFSWICLQGDIDTKDEFTFLYPFPGIHSVNTRGKFLFVNIVQLISYLGIILFATSTCLHLLAIEVEVFNKTVLLEERMKSISNDVHHTMALIWESEGKIDKTKSPRLRELIQRKSQNDKKKCFQKFDENLKICIQHHQKLQHATKYVKQLMNAFFTISLLFCGYEAIVSGFLITSKEKLDFNLPVFKCILVFLFTIWHLLSECLIAQHFHNMNDSIAEQVYSLPWYELSPTYRKNVYIFLCEAQAPVNFRAFQTFPFSTFFFPKVLNFVYTHTMNLLILQTKFRQT